MITTFEDKSGILLSGLWREKRRSRSSRVALIFFSSSSCWRNALFVFLHLTRVFIIRQFFLLLVAHFIIVVRHVTSILLLLSVLLIVVCALLLVLSATRNIYCR
jgi:hypothetical protein